jgi:DNA-directed RNA polymerase specialized sigma24 family protein
MRNGCDRSITEAPNGESFDEVVVPHLDTAYRLACWLLRNDHVAEGAVQEASLSSNHWLEALVIDGALRSPDIAHEDR